MREYNGNQLNIDKNINGEKEFLIMKAFQKWYSEKKPQSGFQPFRENPLNSGIQSANLFDELSRNLDNGTQFIKKESNCSQRPHIPQRTQSDMWVNHQYECPISEGDIDFKYHCTFFPKGTKINHFEKYESVSQILFHEYKI